MDTEAALTEAVARYVRGRQEGLKPIWSLASSLTWLILNRHPNIHRASLACGVRVGINQRNSFSGRPAERLRKALTAGLRTAEGSYSGVVELGPN